MSGLLLTESVILGPKGDQDMGTIPDRSRGIPSSHTHSTPQTHMSGLLLTESVMLGPKGDQDMGTVPVSRGFIDSSMVRRLTRADQLEGSGPVKLQPLRRVGGRVWTGEVTAPEEGGQ